MRIDIDGLLITSTPLHISDVEKARFQPTTHSGAGDEDANGKVIYAAKAPGSFPLTLTRQMEVMLNNPMGKNANQWTLRYPVLPANGLRGALRRQAAAIIEDHLRYDREEKVSFNAYNGLHIGAVTGNPDGIPPSRDEVKAALDHPFMGLFGGGPRMIQSCLRVSTGVPLLERLVEIGMIPDPDRYGIAAIPNAQGWRLLQCVPVVRGDDALQMRDPRAPEVIADYAAAIDAAQQEVMARRARKADDSKDGEEGANVQEGENGRQMLSYAQIVKPGTPFYVRFTLDCTPAQAGLLLQALLNMIRSQDIKGIGGRSAIGYGRYLQNLQVRIDGTSERPFVGNASDCEWNPAAPRTLELLGAMQERLEKVTAAEIEGFFSTRKVSDEEKAAKKAAKKAGKAKKGAADADAVPEEEVA